MATAMTGASNARRSAQDRRHKKYNVAKTQISSAFSPVAKVVRQHRAPKKFFRTATRRSVFARSVRRARRRRLHTKLSGVTVIFFLL